MRKINYELPECELIEKRLKELLHSSFSPLHDYSTVEKDFRHIEMHTKNKLRVFRLAMHLHSEVCDRTIYPRFGEIARFLEERVSILSQYKDVASYLESKEN